MRTGCAFGLFGLSRLITTLFFRLGGWLAAALVTTLVFLLGVIIVPLLLGATLELLHWVFGVRDPRQRPVWQQMGSFLFALLSGVAWVGAYWIAYLVWQLVLWLIEQFALSLGLGLSPTASATSITLALFLVGGVVGTLAYRYQRQGPPGP